MNDLAERVTNLLVIYWLQINDDKNFSERVLYRNQLENYPNDL